MRNKKEKKKLKKKETEKKKKLKKKETEKTTEKNQRKKKRKQENEFWFCLAKGFWVRFGSGPNPTKPIQMDLDDDLEVSTRNEVKADGKKIYVWEEGLNSIGFEETYFKYFERKLEVDLSW